MWLSKNAILSLPEVLMPHFGRSLALAVFSAITLQACADDRAPTAPTSRLQPGPRRNDVSAAAFSDPFEESAIDPFWTVFQQYGTISFSTAEAHSGSQSVQFAAQVAPSSSGPNMILSHVFSAALKGSFTVWFYDAAPGQVTLYQQMQLDNSDGSGVLAAIGVNDFDAYCYMSRLDNGQGQSQGPNANCGQFPQLQTTNVSRTLGWHLLSINVEANDVVFAIDGQTTFTATGDFSFDRVELFLSGPYYRPITTTYFDDFAFVPAVAPNQPPTAVPGTGYTGYEGSPVAFDGSKSFDPDGDALTYAWTFGDGGSATGPTPTHTYADNGTYTATLTVSDGRGGTDSKSVMVSIANVPPTVTGFTVPAQATLSGGTASLQVTNVTFTDPAGSVDAPFTTTIDCGNQTSASAAGVCTYTAVGSYTIAVRVTDKDGGTSAPSTQTVAIVYPFTGFLSPVQNLPTSNTVKAGAAVPVKFSLGGDFGLGVIATGYPLVQGESCATGVPTNDIEQTVTAGNSSLSYDASSQTYTYVWKTSSSWAGTCQRLIVTLVDGTTHQADFYFK